MTVWNRLAGPSTSVPASQEGGSPQHFEVNHRIGPAAAKLLRESGLRADAIQPTGPHNMVTKGDVLAAIKSGLKPSPKPQVTLLLLPLLLATTSLLALRMTFGVHHACLVPAEADKKRCCSRPPETWEMMHVYQGVPVTVSV